MTIFDCFFKKKGARFTHILSLLLILLLSLSICGCGTAYEMPYSMHNDISAYNLGQTEEVASTFPSFASDLCVVSNNINAGAVNMENAETGALFDLNNNETLYAKNPNTQVHPASLTKIMTALVALKYASPDLMLTASDNVNILEEGAQVCGIKAGDQMTLDQALHILLIYSANDVAIMIAEGIAGDVDYFCDLMNQEAQLIGATNSHFSNPNGLTQDEHYVTAYDMYLIFNAALQYSLFNEIIQMTSYETVYYASDGSQKTLSVDTTNLYFKNEYNAPDQITVIGGKTGTTNAAGHCLIIYVRDSSGNPYISVIMNADTNDDLYAYMNELLSYIYQ